MLGLDRQWLAKLSAPQHMQNRSSTTEFHSPRWLERPWLLGLLLAALTFVVYLPVWSYPFVDWDDPIHIWRNSHLSPLSLVNISYFWRHPYEGLYIPLSYTAFAVIGAFAHLRAPQLAPDGQFTDFNPHVFHIANLVVHVANSLIVFAILRLIVRRPLPASAGAALFAIHPLQVESVAWVSEMRGLLGNSLALLSIYAYLLSLGPRSTYENESSASGRRANLLYALAAMLYVLAMLAKPDVVAVPIILFALDWTLFRRKCDVRSVSVFLWLVAAVPIVALTRQAQTLAQIEVAPLLQRPFIAGDALSFYLAKLIAPVHLAVDYGRTPRFVLSHWWGYATWALAALVFGICILGRKSRPELLAACAVFAGALIPVVGLAPFTYQSFSTVADRYVYLAMLGPGIAIAWFAARSPSRRSAVSVAAIVLTCAVLSVAQVHTWRDSTALFSNAVAVTPDDACMHNSLGRAYRFSGDTVDAVQEFRTAMMLDPTYTLAYVNLGNLDAISGNDRDAADNDRIAIRLQPYVPEYYVNLALVLDAEGNTSGALAQYNTAIRLDPQCGPAYYGLGLEYAETRRTGLAIDEWSKALLFQPHDFATRYDLAVALQKTGRTGEARAELDQAMAIPPALRLSGRQAL